MPYLSWVEHPHKRLCYCMCCSRHLPAITFSVRLFIRDADWRLHGRMSNRLLLMLNKHPQSLVCMLKISCRRRPVEDGCLAGRCVFWGAYMPIISRQPHVHKRP